MTPYQPEGKPQFAINIEAINALELRYHNIKITFEGGAMIELTAPKGTPSWEIDDWINKEFNSIISAMENFKSAKDGQ